MEENGQRISYVGKMGTFKPKFQGKPNDYYEVGCKEVFCAISICFTIVIFFFFLAVAFFFWSSKVSTENLVLVWSIILCIFVPVFMVAAYIGSNKKISIQEQLIKKALHKITEEKEKKAHKETKKYLRHEHSISTGKILNEEEI